MNPAFFQKVESTLAPERLDAYRQDGATPEITLARYLWNMALCEALDSPLQIAEIVLRNALHKCLTLIKWIKAKLGLRGLNSADVDAATV